MFGRGFPGVDWEVGNFGSENDDVRARQGTTELAGQGSR